MNLLITGSTGFIGKNLSHFLSKNPNFQIFRSSRFAENNSISLHDIFNNPEWFRKIEHIDVIIHLAGENAYRGNESIFTANTDLTKKLIDQAKNANVKHFIFISTIKVHGEFTNKTQKFHKDSPYNPQDLYALSKKRAEDYLSLEIENRDIDVTIIRPTLVYGPNPKGSINTLIKLISKGFPLPLGRITNRRSFISIDNLNSLIETCIHKPSAKNEIFLASDGNDISTSMLANYLAEAMNTRLMVITIPSWIIKKTLTLLGKERIKQSLYYSLEVDIHHTCNTLGWEPDKDIKSQLKKYINTKSQNH